MGHSQIVRGPRADRPVVAARAGGPIVPAAGPRPARPSRILLHQMATERSYYEILGVERNASRRRHQARLPQARPAVAPRRQHGRGGRRAGSRRSTRPTRSSRIRSGARSTTWSGRAGLGDMGGARRSARASRASATCSTPSSPAWAGPRAGARRSRRQAGSDLRYDLRITFDEAVRGIEKEIEFDLLDRCATCGGSGAAPGSTPVDLHRVRRPGRDPQRAPDDARPDGQRHGLHALPRRGPGGRSTRARRAAARGASSATRRSA